MFRSSRLVRVGTFFSLDCLRSVVVVVAVANVGSLECGKHTCTRNALAPPPVTRFSAEHVFLVALSRSCTSLRAAEEVDTFRCLVTCRRGARKRPAYEEFRVLRTPLFFRTLVPDVSGAAPLYEERFERYLPVRLYHN